MSAEQAGVQHTTAITPSGWIVIAPTYNHAGAAGAVLAELSRHGVPIIVVDDGSTDNTKRVLDGWCAAGEAGSLRCVVRHDTNLGKAAALRTGFAEAARLGFTHAATIDTDEQHDVDDLINLMMLSARHPDALVIGARLKDESCGPLASRVGRAISNRLVWLESGVRVSDSQTGMRVYPLARMDVLAGRAPRYGFETEVLVRAGWQGVAVIETPIRCIYDVPGGRTTHFRLFRDTMSALGMHARLLAGAHVPRLAGSNAAETGGSGTIPWRLARWFSPRRLAAMASGDGVSRERLAASVGIGLLMATLPLYGVKTVVCLWLAARMRLHPLAVVAVSSLSTPPVGFVFVAASVVVGGLLMHGRLDVSSIDLSQLPDWSRTNELLAQWLIGSMVTGTTLGLVGYAVMLALLMRPLQQTRRSHDRASGESV